MSPHEADRRHFERQIVYFRPIIIVLALLALLERALTPASHRAINFLIGYLAFSIFVIFLEHLLSERDWQLPLVTDLLALAVFVYLSPYAVPVWFPYLFLCFAA